MHGVTTKQIRNDFNLQDGQTDIIAALVTVPTYLLKEENKTLNTPIPCRNDKDLAAYCGKNLPDFTGYDTVATILKESGGQLFMLLTYLMKTSTKQPFPNQQ